MQTSSELCQHVETGANCVKLVPTTGAFSSCVNNSKRRTVYIGETSRSGFERIHEHMRFFLARKEGDVERNQSSTVLWYYSKASHGGEMRTSDWKIKITSSHTSALSRPVAEAVRISREPKSSILNSKQEFGCHNIPELEVRYGAKVCNGGMKRKRKEDANSPTSIPSVTNSKSEKNQGAVSPIVPEICEPDLPNEAAAVVTEMAAKDGPATNFPP